MGKHSMSNGELARMEGVMFDVPWADARTRRAELIEKRDMRLYPVWTRTSMTFGAHRRLVPFVGGRRV